MAWRTLTQLLQRLNQTAGGLSDDKIKDLIDTVFSRLGMMNRTLIDLTVVGQTTLYTVPDGYDLYVNDIVLEGSVAQSGGTSSKLLIGTTANSYNELVNGSTGHTFVAATATTLLPAGKRTSLNDIYEETNMNDGKTMKFAAGSVLKADVSGTVLTAGKVYAEIIGRLVPSGT